jgi:hypothetical protein
LPADPGKPKAKPTVYQGAAYWAALFGVAPETVHKWMERYPDFPVPDSETTTTNSRRSVPGWLPEREPEFRAWHHNRPGQGAGGGRPRTAS